MNILHIAAGFDIDFNGGITNYVRSIAKVQALNDNNVFIMCDDGKDDIYKIIKLPESLNRWGYSGKNSRKQLKFLSSFLTNNKIDIIHIHMMLTIDQRIWKIIQKKQVRYVVSLHDYWFICPRIKMVHMNEKRCEKACTKKCDKCFSTLEGNYFLLRVFRRLFGIKFVENFPLKSKKTYRKWIGNTKPLLEGASYLLPVSKRVEEIFKCSNIKGNYKTLHIGNITADDFDYNYSYEHGNAIRLVVLSALSVAKGGELFSEIIKKVNNHLIEIHFYGNATQEELAWFEGVNFINHGPYKQQDLKNILKTMDMGVMTPIWEDNAPQVVMEMINNHLPVFATKMGGITDFVDSNNGYLFDPFSDTEIKNAVQFLNNLDFDYIDKLKKNIKPTETTAEHYRKLMNLYERVCEDDE